MPRLARLRFVNVGHPRSRMRDLTLDFRDPEGHPTDSTLWLRNGGGKSSILNLFFGLVRPGRHEFLGGKADARQRRLENYVLASDRAVIVAEWELDPEGNLLAHGPAVRFLTGVFYEYGSGATSREESRLKHLFFCTQVCPAEPALTLEGLPLFLPPDGGEPRRSTLLGFRQRWRELAESRGYLGMQQTEVAQDWRKTLEDVGIDAELFKYQIRMNTREGGADEVFRFGDGEQFVDFLIELVMNASDGDQVGKNVTSWREELKDRVEKLIPEGEMTAGLGHRLGPLEALADERRSLSLACAREQGRLAAVQRWLSAEAASERIRIERAEEAHRAAGAETERAEGEASGAARVAAGLRRFAARLQGEAAERTRRELEVAHALASRERDLWHAAGPMKEALGHEADAQRRREELSRRTADAEPQRLELVEVAGRLAGRIAMQLCSVRELERQARASVADAEARRTTAERAAKEAHGRAASAESTARHAETELARIDGARVELGKAGLLHSGETVMVAMERFAALQADYLAEIDGLEGVIATSKREHALLEEPIGSALLRLVELKAALRNGRERLAEAESSRRSIEADPLLQEVLELEAPDLDQIADVTLELVGVEARRHAEALVEVRAAREDDERALAGLDASGLLPPTREVEKVLHALSGLRAWSGWAWLESTVPSERRADLVHAAPSHALGVVVRDADLAAARERLAEGALRLDFPVAIVSATNFQGAEPVAGFVIGPATSALFDKSSAVQERAQRRDRVERSTSEEERHRRARSSFDQLHAVIAQFRRDCPQGWFAAQTERLRWIEQDVSDGERSLHESRSRAAQWKRDQVAAEGRAAAARNAERAASDRLGRLRHFVNEQEARVIGLRVEQEGAIDQVTAARRAELDASAIAEEARLAGDAAQLAASSWHAEGRALRDARNAIIYAEQEMDPGIEDIEALRGRYDDLRGQYEGRLNQEQLSALAAESDRHAQGARRKLAERLSPSLTEPDVRAALLASPGADIEARFRESDDARSSAQGRLVHSGHQIKQATVALDEADAACAHLGSVPEPAPAPASIEAAREAAGLAEHDRDRARIIADDWRARAQVEETDMARAERRVGGLAKDLHLLESLIETYAELLTGEPALEVGPASEEESSAAIDTADRALREARRVRVTLDAKRAEAVQSVRAWIDEPQFEALRHAMARQFGRLSDVELETRAAELRGQLALRAQILDGQVAGVDRHRELLLTQLAGVADDGLAVLKSAENASRLPESIPGFAGRSFLRIHHAAPEDSRERNARLGELLDQMVRDEKEIPGGVLLIQRIVRKLVHPARVKVLFPDPTSSEAPMDIAEVAKFSGGEQLTCAILLYCTLAQMRARRSGRRRRSSVLVLDNPIGRASSTRFLELQRDVARAMDIQLLYTTGVNDHEALHALPNRIRLRNDRADRTRGHQVVEHEEGEILAVRFQRREPAAAGPTHEQDGA